MRARHAGRPAASSPLRRRCRRLSRSWRSRLASARSPLFTLHARGPASAASHSRRRKRCGAPAPKLPGAASGTTEMAAPAAEGDSVGMLSNKSTGACCGCGAARPPAGGSWRAALTPALRRRTCVVLAVWSRPRDAARVHRLLFHTSSRGANLMQSVARARTPPRRSAAPLARGRRRLHRQPPPKAPRPDLCDRERRPSASTSRRPTAAAARCWRWSAPTTARAEIVWSTLKTFTVELFPTEARGKAWRLHRGRLCRSSLRALRRPVADGVRAPGARPQRHRACGAVLICDSRGRRRGRRSPSEVERPNAV